MSTLIANPPRGIYKGPATIGQAAYHVWLDMQARFLSRSESVLLHARAHNAFGKRAEQLPGSPVEAGKAHLAVTLLQQDVRDTIDTRSKEVYVDDTPAIIEQARATLSKLIANGHVEELGGALILKTSSLQLQTKTLAALSKATIIPERLRKPLRDAVFEATDIQITTDTKYAPVWKNSNIAPLFVLASGWDAFSQYDKIIYATSHNTAVKYGLLRAAISAGSESSPFQTLYVFPRATLGVDAQVNLENGAGKSAFRYALAKAHSTYNASVTVTHEKIIGGTRLH